MTIAADNAYQFATRSAERYAQHVAATIRDNVAYLLATRGDDPEARAWACVAELIDVATSTIAANAARGGLAR